MIALSSNMLLLAFFLYLFSTLSYAVTITGTKMKSTAEGKNTERWGRLGYIFAFTGFLAHLSFIVLRWIASGHAPTSNMFEYMTFFAFSIVVAFLIIHRIYNVKMLGVFVMPLAMLIVAYASVFPREATPLIPALQSYWLYIHVTFAALGEGAFAIAFAAGLMYLIHKVDQSKRSVETGLLEFTIYSINALVAFILLVFLFNSIGYTDEFIVLNDENKEQVITYTMPTIVSPFEGKLISDHGFKPLFEAPYWMKGVNAGNNFNTIIWSLIGGAVLYIIQRLIARKRLAKVAQKWFADIDDEVVDEIGYRAVAIGFPIFTLGALIFAMIWAAEAWGRFWAWDPKEVWALITWFYYSIYLHLRLSSGWQGKRSAWMAVLGFIVVMFTLVGVNLVISGLHSYA